MLRIIPLQGRIQNAIKFLQTFDDRAKEAGVATGDSRPLRESDIQVVRDGMRKMGKKTFTDTAYETHMETHIDMPGLRVGRNPSPRPDPYLTLTHVSEPGLKVAASLTLYPNPTPTPNPNPIANPALCPCPYPRP